MSFIRVRDADRGARAPAAGQIFGRAADAARQVRRQVSLHVRQRVQIALALALALSAAACSTLDPEAQKIGAPTTTPVPAEAPRTTGGDTRASAEHKRLVAMFGGEYNAPTVAAYLDGVLAKLSAVADPPGPTYRVTILNSPAINAFALPSGNLYVTRGLLALANDSSEIAAVMAHEIGHVTARHALAREERAKTEKLRSDVARAIQGPKEGDESRALGRLTLASFSRQQELEADRIGVQMLVRAGFDPYGASRFLRSLGRSVALSASALGSTNSDDKPDIMSSHPSTPERINRAVLAAREFAAPGLGDAGRDAWLNVIDGIDFGDDPAEGFVRGRRFIHGKLGFTFTAPDGFAFENSAQVLVGYNAAGSQALRLDSVRTSEAALDAYLKTGWVEGLKPDSIRTETINGLPAATALADNGGWKFRIAVFRLGSDVYRLIFAAQTLTPDLESQFDQSIRSFRRLPSSEAQSLRALRLRLVTAQPGDTPESFGARMAVSAHKLDVFLLLNGLQKGKPLDIGKRYKIVVE